MLPFYKLIPSTLTQIPELFIIIIIIIIIIVIIMYKVINSIPSDVR
jgi:hypothetical protein